METGNILPFKSLSENVGHFNLVGKTLLIPEMNKIGCRLLAATFISFGINAVVMETGKDIRLGLEHSSGKECYPCHVTLGDVLYHMRMEKDKKGRAFNPSDYIYFMPEAEGPCRFGMYNKYQRIVLDSFPDLRGLKIGSLTTMDGYSLEGIIEESKVSDLKKASFFAIVIGDILDRILWRIRPYEKEPGLADDFIEDATKKMERSFNSYAPERAFNRILSSLEEVSHKARDIIDPTIPSKPVIGIVGEIYLRSHIYSNQDLIRSLERYGAEVVNASIGEWINYITYNKLRESGSMLRLKFKQLRLSEILEELKKITRFFVELRYQEFRQKQAYTRTGAIIDIYQDHKVAHLERRLQEKDLFTFDIGTEACLSISGILEYMRGGFNGIVNVYPFTCMPSTVTSAILRPLMSRSGIPYLDTSYDSSIPPGREAAIRTFMYQAQQHMSRMGRSKNPVYN